MIFISEVQDAFVVTGKGLFIVPAIPQGDFPAALEVPDSAPNSRWTDTGDAYQCRRVSIRPRTNLSGSAKAAVAEAHRHAKAVFPHPQNLDGCGSRGARGLDRQNGLRNWRNYPQAGGDILFGTDIGHTNHFDAAVESSSERQIPR